MFRKDDSDSIMDVWGISGEMAGQIASNTPDVWLVNLDAYNVFAGMQTQWRYRNGVISGLEYSSLDRVLKRFDIQPEEENDVFIDLQYMESVAIKTVYDQLKQSQS
jgi:hypothetical protein